MTFAAVMLQGTASDVGKSLLVAGIGRAFTRRGLSVRPFKPQNMSNNAAVAGGGEIGRAQALQARACRAAASVDMNPVLLKPQSEVGAQLVVSGRVRRNVRAREFQGLKGELLPEVLAAYRRLAAAADLMLVEGAGSPAEVNLRDGDIANMGFARAARVPVVLVGDIDRGGVIASVYGTWKLLAPADRRWLRGFIVNKFRGDPGLFDSGVAILRAKTNLESLGVVPFIDAASELPAEDAVEVNGRSRERAEAAIRVAVPVVSRIANFDDLDPLRAEPDVSVAFIEAGRALPGDADLVILPGSKSTIADLVHVRAQGWDVDLVAHVRRGGWVLGLCGGFQMLGRVVRDPHGIEGNRLEAPGLGLLELDTELGGDKRLVERAGLDALSGQSVRGYEMHVGRTTGPALERPMLRLEGEPHGAVSVDGRVHGCYLHGLFRADAFRHAYLNRIRNRHTSGVAYESRVEQALEALADEVERHLDLDRLLALAQGACRAKSQASATTASSTAPAAT